MKSEMILIIVLVLILVVIYSSDTIVEKYISHKKSKIDVNDLFTNFKPTNDKILKYNPLFDKDNTKNNKCRKNSSGNLIPPNNKGNVPLINPNEKIIPSNNVRPLTLPPKVSNIKCKKPPTVKPSCKINPPKPIIPSPKCKRFEKAKCSHKQTNDSQCEEPIKLSCNKSLNNPISTDNSDCGNCVCPNYPDMSQYVLKSKLATYEKAISNIHKKKHEAHKPKHIVHKAIPNLDLTKYILKSKIPKCHPLPDLSKYVLKSSIPVPCKKCMDKPCERGGKIPTPKPKASISCPYKSSTIKALKEKSNSDNNDSNDNSINNSKCGSCSEPNHNVDNSTKNKIPQGIDDSGTIYESLSTNINNNIKSIKDYYSTNDGMYDTNLNYTESNLNSDSDSDRDSDIDSDSYSDIYKGSPEPFSAGDMFK